MKHDRWIFLTVEFALAAAAALMMLRMSAGREPARKISVIVSQPDEDRWELFLHGVKQAASACGLDAEIVTTDTITGAEQEEELMENAVADGAEALIVQPAPGGETKRMLTRIAEKIPVVETGGGSAVSPGAASDRPETASSGAEAAEGGDDGAGGAGTVPLVGPDYEAMGHALGRMLIDDRGSRLKGVRIGIAGGLSDTDSIAAAERGLEETLRESGCRIVWTLRNLPDGDEAGEELTAQTPTDVVIALDTQSVERAGDCAAEGALWDASVYGIGMSTKSIYHLDRGHVRGLVVPGCFEMGYRAVIEAAAGIRKGRNAMRSRTTSCRIVRRADLFTEENEQLLFSLDQ